MSHLGPLLQILISIFPLFCFRGPLKYLARIPDEHAHNGLVCICTFLRLPRSPPRYQSSAVCSIDTRYPPQDGNASDLSMLACSRILRERSPRHSPGHAFYFTTGGSNQELPSTTPPLSHLFISPSITPPVRLELV